jgi:hypothetical protein
VSKPGRMPKGSQQWTDEQAAWLDAEAARLGLQSRAAVARMIVQAEIDRRRTKQNGDEAAA